MQGEYAPQEDRRLYLIKHSPNDRRRAFGHGFADSLAVCAYAPTLRMLLDMNIVGERKSGPPATAVTQITSDRSEEDTCELQSLMCISYAGFCLQYKNT